MLLLFLYYSSYFLLGYYLLHHTTYLRTTEDYNLLLPLLLLLLLLLLTLLLLSFNLQAGNLNVPLPLGGSTFTFGVCYTFENTCLLSVYGYPTWEMVCGVKAIEVRCSECSFQHVIVCCSLHEDTTSDIPPCPEWMHKGCAYLIFSVGKFLPLMGKRCVGWEMRDTKVLRIPFQLRAGEYPKQGPCRLDRTKSGHVSLLRTLNDSRNFV